MCYLIDFADMASTMHDQICICKKSMFTFTFKITYGIDKTAVPLLTNLSNFKCYGFKYFKYNIIK